VAFGTALLTSLSNTDSNAFPIGKATFKDDAPFAGSWVSSPLTSSDGLLTVAAWADSNATIGANLYQWWWIFGVDSGVGNGALLDGNEAMTLQFDKGVGASTIFFLYTGGNGGTTNNLARLSISGFLNDPKAYATTANAPRISNLTYASGTLSFDYLWDGSSDYGQLLFANPSAAGGQRLKITGAASPNGDATGYGAALFSASWQETAGQPQVTPVNVRLNYTNSLSTPDGAVTVKGYSDRNATVPASFGTYFDQCFGVYGGANNGAIDTDETVTVQFASGVGLSRLDGVYASGQVTISGFVGDPGFTDLGGGSFGMTYSSGVLSFYPSDGGHHLYFFTTRAASAGRTLRINVDPGAGYSFPIASIGYATLHTMLAADIPSNVTATKTAPDGLLTVSGYADTPGTVEANLYENVDWLGVAGGNNDAIDGTESLNLQFSGGAGLSSLGTRFSSGGVVISGFTSDPGFTDPSGTATGVTYSGGTLSYTFNQFRAPEVVVRFTDTTASAGQTLSLHTDGNAGSQLALTEIGYAVSPTTISIEKVGNNVVLTWPGGTLQQSTSVNGAYEDMTGVTSPYTNAISGPQKFFRVKVQ
jgi:hypothetical protein